MESLPGLAWELSRVTVRSSVRGGAASFKHFFFPQTEGKKRTGLIPEIFKLDNKVGTMECLDWKERNVASLGVGRMYNNFQRYENSWFWSTVNTAPCQPACSLPLVLNWISMILFTLQTFVDRLFCIRFVPGDHSAARQSNNQTGNWAKPRIPWKVRCSIGLWSQTAFFLFIYLNYISLIMLL